MNRPLPDHEQRERIRSDLDTTLLVEAAAGTGKTSELVRRIVALLAAGRAAVGGIVAVTFTEKAAGELKLRLRTAIEEERNDDKRSADERARLAEALAHLEEAWMGTIHAFCADLLRERSIEACVDPEFSTLNEGESRRLYREAFDLWLQERLEAPPEGVRRALRRGTRFEPEGPVGRLRNAGWTLTEWRDFPAAWGRPPFAREEQIDGLVDFLAHFARVSGSCTNPDRDALFKATQPARRLSETIDRLEAVRDRDYDGLEAQLIELWEEWRFRNPYKGRGDRYGRDGDEEVTRPYVLEQHAELVARLEMFRAGADADIAAVLQQELLEVVDRYELLKSRRGALDFVDLLLRARDLLVGDPVVRRSFHERFSQIFVDEFQDTDPLQAEILLLLAGDDPHESRWEDVTPRQGKLFLVGDPKQSIYRFRRADVGVYLSVKEQLLRHGGECITLSTSFRSTPSIQGVVNHAFESAIVEDPGAYQAGYVPLEAVRVDPGDQPSVVALPVPKAHGSRGVTKDAINRSTPGAVAAFVKWLLDESGWTVTTREDPNRRVPVESKHVCLLFRRFTSFFAGDVTRPYVDALEAHGVRHLLVGGSSFHGREEIGTLRTALSAIEWPDDELSVFGALRGSLFSLGDEELFEFWHRAGHLHPFRPAPDDLPESLRPVGQALGILAELHRRRHRQPIGTTIAELLEETRAHAAFALRPSGEQTLANVLHLTEQARAYERSGGLSFRGFVERLAEEAERGEAPEAPVLEEGSDGVRMMTVHRAKGLEFPVVVLADPTANLASATASRFVDTDPDRRLCAVRLAGWAPVDLLENEALERERDRAESVRLAYVAATRARDLLVVPAVGSGPLEGGWYDPLMAALYPPHAEWRSPTRAAGCPEFGDRTVLDHPDPVFEGGITPGEYAPGGAPVVWWDAEAIDKRPPERPGVRRADLIAPSEEGTNRERDDYHAWVAERLRIDEAASAPSLTVRTVTEEAEVAIADDDPDRVETTASAVRVEQIEADPSRPRGARFGALVHAVLAEVPFDAGPETQRQLVELHGRILGAPDEERRAAAELLPRFLAHPMVEDVRAARFVRRETPLTLRKSDGVLVEGVVDLAYSDGAKWIAVDFKSDLHFGDDPRLSVISPPAEYRRQVAIYARAIETATGLPCEPVLFAV